MLPPRLLEALSDLSVDGTRLRDWSILVGESRNVSLGIKDREVGGPHAPLRLTESCSAQFRLIWDDGLVSRGTLERTEIEDDPGPALRHVRAAAHEDPDAAWVLGPAPMPEVAMWHAHTAELASGCTDAWVPRLDAVLRQVAARGIRTWSGSFWAGAGRSTIATSAGLLAQSEGTTAGWHVTLNGEIGSGFAARAPETDEAFAMRLERLMDLVARLERPAPRVTAGIRPVLLHPRVVEEYVLETLMSNLNGSAVAHGEGHFRREQFGGDPVLRQDLGLRIDPLLPLRRGSYRYTGEGVPAAPCTFIEAGRLVRPVLDLKYARRLGLKPTPAPAGTDTLFFEGAPPLTFEAGLDAVVGSVLVPSVLGVHTQDSASGDFSLAAPQALAVGPDGPTGKVPATLSGNLFDVLRDDGLRLVDFPDEHTPGLVIHCRLDPR